MQNKQQLIAELVDYMKKLELALKCAKIDTQTILEKILAAGDPTSKIKNKDLQEAIGWIKCIIRNELVEWQAVRKHQSEERWACYEMNPDMFDCLVEVALLKKATFALRKAFNSNSKPGILKPKGKWKVKKDDTSTSGDDGGTDSSINNTDEPIS